MPGSTALRATLLFGVVLLAFLASPVQQHADSYYSVLLSQTLLEKGSFALDSAFAFPLEPERYPGLRPDGLPYHIEPANGHLYYRYPPGSSLLSMPFVAVFDALGISTLDAQGRFLVAGERQIGRWMAALVSTAFVTLVFFTGRLLLPDRWSLVLAFATGFGTQVWSTASRALWSHGWNLLLLGLAVHQLLGLETRRAKSRPLLLGTLLAWAYFTRPTSAIPLAAVSVYAVVRTRASWRPLAASLALWGGAFAAYSWHHFGRILPSYYTAPLGRGHFWEALAGHLVSPSRGLVVYVPQLLFVLLLIVRYGRRLSHPGLVLLALAVIAVHGVAVSSWAMWWGGHSYGPRLMTDLLPWWVLLGACALQARLESRGPSPPGERAARLEVACGAFLAAVSLGMNAPGALSWRTWSWNAFPVSVDDRPERLWDWSDPQFLAWARGRSTSREDLP